MSPSQYFAHDPATKLLIPVGSRSDSLIADLALSCEISPEAYDKIISLLRNPAFSVEDLTLASGTKFYSYIAQYSARVDAPPPARDVASRKRMIDIIFELLLDHLKQQMYSPLLDLGTDEDSEENYRRVAAELSRLAIVHRSWRERAQSALQTRIIIDSPSQLAALSWRGRIGHTTKEFSFRGRWADGKHMRDLVKILSRMRNLRFLAINLGEYDARNHLDTMNDLIHTIGYMESLEELCFPVRYGLESVDVHMDSPDRSYLISLCKEIVKLKELRLLWISKFGSSDVESAIQPSHALSNSGPPPLRTVIFQVQDCHAPAYFIRWLLVPNGSPKLRGAVIHTTNHSIFKHNIDDFTFACQGGSFACVERLYLQMDYFYRLSDSENFMPEVLTQCTSLRTLRLASSSILNVTSLPPQLENITIEVMFLDEAERRKETDDKLTSLLSQYSTPKLKSIAVYDNLFELSYWTPSTQDDVAVVLPSTAELCSRRGITLEYTKEGSLDTSNVALRCDTEDAIV